MCDPLTIIGGLASAGGVALNAAAQNKVEAARADAMKAEQIRQAGFDKRASAVNATSRQRFKNIEGARQRKADRLGDYFTQQDVAEPTKEKALPISTSDMTVQEEAKQIGQVDALSDRTGKALGELRSFGDLLGSKSLSQAQDATKIGQIGMMKEGSQAVLPMELEAANQKGQGLRLFGDILGGLGGLAVSKGLSTAAPFKSTGTLSSVLGYGTPISTSAATIPAARALDRASVPGYAGLSNLYRTS